MAGSQENRSELSILMEEAERLSCRPDSRALEAASGNCAPNLLWREKVCQWCYDVVDHLGKSRDVVFVTLNILDRYCAVRNFEKDGDVTEKEYEIYAMTALFLSFRISGFDDLNVADLVGMSRLGVRIDDIVEAGSSMTTLLSWDAPILTPFQFCRALLRAVSDSVDEEWIQTLTDSASYLVEISVCDAFFSGRSSLVVALAALHSALRQGTASSESFCCKSYREELYKNNSALEVNHEEFDLLRSRLQHIFSRTNESRQSSPHVIPLTDEPDVEQDRLVLLRPCSEASSRAQGSKTQGSSASEVWGTSEYASSSDGKRGSPATVDSRKTKKPRPATPSHGS
jgi:hypothetical protein